jgi:hypothetical protein
MGDDRNGRLIEAYRRVGVDVHDLPYTTAMQVLAGLAGYPGDRAGLSACWGMLLRLHRAGRLPLLRMAEAGKGATP